MCGSTLTVVSSYLAISTQFYKNTFMIIASDDVTSYDKPTSTSSGNPTSSSGNPTSISKGILL